MSQSDRPVKSFADFAREMRRDWDERARQNAKWFINTVKQEQSDEEFDETGRIEVDKWITAELAFLTQGRPPRSLRLLEIGCGIGRMTRHLAELFGEVYAVDVSGEMIRQARERLPHLPNVHLYETDGCDFAGLPSDYFDLVFSAYVFQHVPSAEVIRANITDAYRLLRPGGIFKLQTNSTANPAYKQVAQNTWSGATFPESEIRRTARELGAQLIRVDNAGTQYCWTTLRKRPASELLLPRITTQLQIECYGRSDDPRIKEVPAAGDQASLALIISGPVSETVDANTLLVEIGGREVWPRYVGPVSSEWSVALKDVAGISPDQLTQIETGLPAGLASGDLSVRVCLIDGSASWPITITLAEPEPVTPAIVTVRNASDYGTDVHRRGAKAWLMLYVEGLDETADTSNVRLQVGGQIIEPSYVGSAPQFGGHQVNLQLPSDIEPGWTELRLHFRGVQSPSTLLRIDEPD